jgi:hypothetical protein
MRASNAHSVRVSARRQCDPVPLRPAFFLLRCTAFSDSRTTLLQRINTLVQQSEPPWSPHRRWRIEEQSEDEQFRILCGNAHAMLRPPKTQQQYLRWLLIEVDQWMQQHRAHQEFLRDILQPK